MTIRVSSFLSCSSAVTEDLRLIEKINIVTQDKYEGLSATVQDMMVTSSKIQQAYSEMEEYMDQADTVCQQIQDLEDMAKQLEACSRQLEIKFRRFD
ncbi:biogenesis of lysosome-related organelles complex-1, subunit 2 [Dimargaris cristalligena]|uniref:Biogenesis of lysosome-related organelles complex-1, subunit 2 n=1 Tax=Dimargaris cristalligena TaxID=215637 RepID=A0A4P9ZPG5_9FUNG|nr:biogenesis of lysosome-related organelles complex-1, subunit 2 [Dimargaris cristalligena]|eukprot:RKP34472.1 biogenesis of lysosome-related organelles complex-1, subunit 2 [Dimargaris cristalligena]